LSLDTVRAEVARRDAQDMGRDVAPLRRPNGALVLDSTSMTAEAVIDRLVEAVERVRCCTRS
jgi:CMP/dCMP kinase